MSSQTFFLTNYTNINNLNVSGTTKLNGAITCINNLNISGITQLNNCLNNSYYAVSSGVFAAPSLGINGGVGDKIIL